MADEANDSVKRVCVAGAGGYIGSWLVKNLLERGYTVNATLRNPGDEKKSAALLELPGAEERLKLFKADLCLEGSFDSAVEGCHGVFHVASPMDFTKAKPDDFIVPAVNGVLNVMRACVGGLVIGPWFTTTNSPTSAQAILALTGGNDKFYEVLKFGDFMLGCIPIVHIDDTCNAHIFLMEHTDAQNRYVCASDSLSWMKTMDLRHACLFLQRNCWISVSLTSIVYQKLLRRPWNVS